MNEAYEVELDEAGVVDVRLEALEDVVAELTRRLAKVQNEGKEAVMADFLR